MRARPGIKIKLRRCRRSSRPPLAESPPCQCYGSVLSAAAAVWHEAVCLRVLIEVVAIVRVSHARGWVFAGYRVYARSVTASRSVEFVAAADAVHL